MLILPVSLKFSIVSRCLVNGPQALSENPGSLRSNPGNTYLQPRKICCKYCSNIIETKQRFFSLR